MNLSQRFKTFYENGKRVDDQLNRWLDENPSYEITDWKIMPGFASPYTTYSAAVIVSYYDRNDFA